MALGSKRFEEQRAERKRGEPGTLIRSRNYSNRVGGGERRAIGRIRKVSLLIGGWVEALIRRGTKGPTGEQRSGGRSGLRNWSRETGLRWRSRPNRG
jgi:hypothetical protein